MLVGKEHQPEAGAVDAREVAVAFTISSAASRSASRWCRRAIGGDFRLILVVNKVFVLVGAHRVQ